MYGGLTCDCCGDWGVHCGAPEYTEVEEERLGG